MLTKSIAERAKTAFAVVFLLSSLVAAESVDARTYVLVHGAWVGNYTWLELEPLLREQGHEVYNVSLTGLGDRKHLASPEIDLDTHIDDVVNVIEVLDLNDVYLVGHSYGGMVITGAWDRARERIEHIIYVDAVVPEEGQTLMDFLTEDETHRVYLGAGRNNGMVTMESFIDESAPPPPGMEGDSAAVRWLMERMQAQSIKTWTQPLRLTRGELPGDTAKTYILCLKNPRPNELAERIEQDSSWNYFEMDEPHNVMMTNPEGLAEILMGLP